MKEENIWHLKDVLFAMLNLKIVVTSKLTSHPHLIFPFRLNFDEHKVVHFRCFQGSRLRLRSQPHGTF